MNKVDKVLTEMDKVSTLLKSSDEARQTESEFHKKYMHVASVGNTEALWMVL